MARPAIRASADNQPGPGVWRDRKSSGRRSEAHSQSQRPADYHARAPGPAYRGTRTWLWKVELVAFCDVRLSVLTEVKCTPFADVVRMGYLVSDREDFERCWRVLRRRFGAARSAANRTLIHPCAGRHRYPAPTPTHQRTSMVSIRAVKAAMVAGALLGGTLVAIPRASAPTNAAVVAGALLGGTPVARPPDVHTWSHQP
jgi:hypothetical protein